MTPEMQKLTLPKVTFDTLGWVVCDWIEAFLCHGRGDVQRQAIRLDPEEMLHICWCYRIYPKDHPQEGRRLVNRAIYCRSKGARKSEIAAMLCCAEALGPVRFGGWDAKGEPVGISVTDPFIRVMATEEGQSSNIWDHISYMMTEGKVANDYRIDVGRSSQTSTRIFIKETTGGEMVPSTSGDASKDGGRESFVCADEGHLYISRQLKKMHEIVANNTGKRKAADPWMFEPTTSWQPGERSITEMAYDKYGNLGAEEAVTEHGVLFDMRQGVEPKIFARNDSLTIALKVAYGPYKQDWTDFPKICRLIRQAEDPEATAYRFFLNIPRASSTTWLKLEQIKAVLGKVNVEPGDSIAVGWDGSESDDHSALMGCTEAGDLFALGLWTPSGEPHWRDDVDETVDATFSTFKVVRFYGDPAWWQENMSKWANKHGSPPIVEFWTGQRNETKVATATGALKTAITRTEDSERITIDPEPRFTPEIFVDGRSLLQWHFENARARKRRIKIEDKTEDAYILRKEQPSSPLKIDGAISGILARRARDDAVKEDLFKTKAHGIYAW